MWVAFNCLFFFFQMNDFVASSKQLDDLRCQEAEALAKLNANKMEQDTKKLSDLLDEANEGIAKTQKRISVLRQVVKICTLMSRLWV